MRALSLACAVIRPSRKPHPPPPPMLLQLPAQAADRGGCHAAAGRVAGRGVPPGERVPVVFTNHALLGLFCACVARGTAARRCCGGCDRACCERALALACVQDTFEDATSIHLIMELCEGGSVLDGLKEGEYSEKQVMRGRARVWEGREGAVDAWPGESARGAMPHPPTNARPPHPPAHPPTRPHAHPPTPHAQVAHIMRAVLRFIAQCHTKGIVYRDIKPDNFLLVQKAGVGCPPATAPPCPPPHPHRHPPSPPPPPPRARRCRSPSTAATPSGALAARWGWGAAMGASTPPSQSRPLILGCPFATAQRTLPSRAARVRPGRVCVCEGVGGWGGGLGRRGRGGEGRAGGWRHGEGCACTAHPPPPCVCAASQGPPPTWPLRSSSRAVSC